MADSDWIFSLVQRHEMALCRYAFSLCGDEAMARDAVQECFLRLCKTKRHKIEGHEAAWLYRVCRTRVIDLQRKEKPMQELSPALEASLPSTEASPDLAAQHQDRAAKLPELLSRLPERDREAVTLKFQENLSYREIAEVLGISEGNVGYILHHALRKLRTELTSLKGALS